MTSTETPDKETPMNATESANDMIARTTRNYMENLTQRVETARAALADAVATCAVSEVLTDLAHSVGVAEAELDVWRTVDGNLASPTALDALTALDRAYQAWVDAILASGADDTWSGRGNDLRRAKFDARRRQVERVADLRRSALAVAGD